MQPEDLRKVDAVSRMHKSFEDLRCSRIDLAAEPPISV